MRQSVIMRAGEADEWFKRNLHAPLNPVVINALNSIECKPDRIVEVGCGYGRYLNEMQKHYKCHSVGYDPSKSAIRHGRVSYPDLDLRIGSSDAFHGMTIDILVFGFCLYLVDREDLFHLVTLANYCVNDGGYIVIHDFDPDHPQVIPYHHKKGVFSYKMNYPALWLANPAYELVLKTITAEGEAISILRKRGWSKWQF